MNDLHPIARFPEPRTRRPRPVPTPGAQPALAERVGVVLAAGLGSRLAMNGAETSHKPLITVGGEPLLLRTLRSLGNAGCSKAVIVLGHEADVLRREIESRYRGPLDLQFVLNERYRLRNGLSVLCARPYTGDDFVLTMADHVLGDEIMNRVRGYQPPERGAALCVDFRIDSVFDLADATKVLQRDGRIVAIGKELPEYDCIDTGVFCCTSALMDALESVYARQGDASLSEGVQRLAAEGRMAVIDIGDGYWQDVDTPEMLAHAESTLGRR